MAIFDNLDNIRESSDNSINQDLKNPNELLEAYIADELSFAPIEKLKEFANSPEAEAMIEAGLISRKTLVRLSKNDDLTRRTKMAAFQLAKEADDNLWHLLVKNRVRERELISKIVAKYASRASKSAKIGQREYLKNKMPLSMMRKSIGDDDRR